MVEIQGKGNGAEARPLLACAQEVTDFHDKTFVVDVAEAPEAFPDFQGSHICFSRSTLPRKIQVSVSRRKHRRVKVRQMISFLGSALSRRWRPIRCR